MILLDDEAIAARAARWAAALRDRGLAPGDRVAVREGNTVEMVVAREAAARAGLVFVPVNPRLTEPEVAHVLAVSGAPLLDLAELDAGAGAGAGAAASLPAAAGAGATLLFTSGTTGRPKGCLRTDAQETARADELIATYALGPDEVHLVTCPLAHSAPGIFLRAVRRAGGRVLLAPRFDAAAFADAVRAWRVTSAFLVPTQVERLLELRPAADWSSVRALIVAGAPFSPATRERMRTWLGPGRLWEFYGASELGTVTVLPPSEPAGEAGCVGRPPPGVELRLADDGEIFVRSPTVMAGYVGEAPVTGFVSVGDVGRFDDAGRLVLVDRKIDVVISGGVNVYPAEVEHALRDHPDVAGAVVTGIPDADWGEAVVAVVAARAGAILDEEGLRTFLRGRLAGYKLPRRFVFVPSAELPVGSSGKPLRRAARRLFWSEA